MSVRICRSAALAALVVILVTSSITLAPNLYAQAAAQPTSIKAALEAHAGKRTKVQLLSGQDLEGKVQSVGSEVFVIAELTGMEFFSATVRIDQVAAVIYRADNP